MVVSDLQRDNLTGLLAGISTPADDVEGQAPLYTAPLTKQPAFVPLKKVSRSTLYQLGSESGTAPHLPYQAVSSAAEPIEHGSNVRCW